MDVVSASEPRPRGLPRGAGRYYTVASAPSPVNSAGRALSAQGAAGTIGLGWTSARPHEVPVLALLEFRESPLTNFLESRSGNDDRSSDNDGSIKDFTRSFALCHRPITKRFIGVSLPLTISPAAIAHEAF